MEKPTALQSLAAGIIAGSIEASITYPTDYVKTQLQLGDKKYKGVVDVAYNTVKSHGFSGLYRGVSTAVVGTGVKGGVRFLVYEESKTLWGNILGKGTLPALILSGITAGSVEAIIAVTPTETIKTKLIQEQSRQNPRFKSLYQATSFLIRENGVSGIYQGVFPVIARQAANSAVRLASYTTMREYILERYGQISWYSTFLLGSVAGALTVYCTMPIDVIKTKMQKHGAKGTSITCLTDTVKNEGFFALWKGTTPRLARLLVSGGIVFMAYEETLKIFNSVEKLSRKM